jgi:hypothetical protein
VDPGTGVALAGVSTDAHGHVVPFKGPDGVVEGWVDFGGGRFKLTAVDSGLFLPVATLDGLYAALPASPAAFNIYGRDGSNNPVWTTSQASVARALGWAIVTDPAYGAKLDGVTDDTAAIQSALNAASTAYVPPGTAAIAGTLVPRAGTSLILASGATLNRPVAMTSTDPLVWLQNNSATLRGQGSRVSTISTANAAPYGIVCIGNKGTGDATGRQANYNTVRDLALIGRQPGGETTGTASVALLLCNMQISGLTSYFNTFENLYLASSNIGVQFLGNANANIGRNIQLNGVGNNATLNGAAVKLSHTGTLVPIENHIDGVMHTASASAVTLWIEGASGAVPSFNVLNGVCCEQGGASAYSVKNTYDGATNNIVIGADNTALGMSLTTNFLKQNTVMLGSNVWAGTVAASNVKMDTITYTGANTVASARTGGTAAALPAQPVGYLAITIYGATNYIPYYS